MNVCQPRAAFCRSSGWFCVVASRDAWPWSCAMIRCAHLLCVCVRIYYAYMYDQILCVCIHVCALMWGACVHVSLCVHTRRCVAYAWVALILYYHRFSQTELVGFIFRSIVDQTIDKTIVNDCKENEPKKIGLGKPAVIWD